MKTLVIENLRRLNNILKRTKYLQKHNSECRPIKNVNSLILQGELNSPCSMQFPPNTKIFVESFNLGGPESPDNFVLLDGESIPYQTPLESQV